MTATTATIGATTAHSRMPAMIGGIVGGVVILIILTVIILIFLLRRCRHKRQAQEDRIESIPTHGSPYDESFGNSLTSATSLLAAAGERKSMSSISRQPPEKPPTGLYPLRFIPPSSSRGEDEKKEPEHEDPSNLPEPSLIRGTPDQEPFSTEGQDETGQSDSTGRAQVDDNDSNRELETRNPVVSSDTRVTSAGPSMIDNEQLVARLEYMAQRIAWLESEGRSPPQYTQ
ncbi:hypothetical protein PQX77_010412 [Marasmius sp. AFHP31]|nr:hypothetical protein PQX77_010412 [Marasmius sp. AFHP31]